MLLDMLIDGNVETVSLERDGNLHFWSKPQDPRWKDFRKEYLFPLDPIQQGILYHTSLPDVVDIDKVITLSEKLREIIFNSDIGAGAAKILETT